MALLPQWIQLAEKMKKAGAPSDFPRSVRSWIQRASALFWFNGRIVFINIESETRRVLRLGLIVLKAQEL
jgi:hypothetical protein